ncbi:MAG: DUF4468 domain-containing protein [Prolixibacteraceae bacterium]|jgi:hypothetical protein|nr:DUF4468 domain-containing protein [Prolixibacteraceae bacterium]
MKKLIIILLFSPFICFSQNLEIDKESGKYTKQEVIEIENKSKDDLFNKTIEWITLNYNSADDVIQLKDKELGKIIIKGNFSSSMYMKQGWINHTLVLDFKDNKLRYKYTDFSYYSTGSGEMPFEKSMMSKKKMLKETEEKIDNSILSLKEHLIKDKDDSNW